MREKYRQLSAERGGISSIRNVFKKLRDCGSLITIFLVGFVVVDDADFHFPSIVYNWYTFLEHRITFSGSGMYTPSLAQCSACLMVLDIINC